MLILYSLWEGWGVNYVKQNLINLPAKCNIVNYEKQKYKAVFYTWLLLRNYLCCFREMFTSFVYFFSFPFSPLLFYHNLHKIKFCKKFTFFLVHFIFVVFVKHNILPDLYLVLDFSFIPTSLFVIFLTNKRVEEKFYNFYFPRCLCSAFRRILFSSHKSPHITSLSIFLTLGLKRYSLF